jgi:hypothetical protein
LTKDDYLQFINQADCFVSLSMGEGYSIVPREFLAAGKPVILSNCFAHAEILADLSAIGENLVFPIEADVPVPAIYDHVFGGGMYGIQYDSYRPSACHVLERVYNMRHSLFDSETVTLRREWSKQYDRGALTPLYRSIVEPRFCRKTTGNELEFGGVSTSDANLASRMLGSTLSHSDVQNLREKPVKYVVIGNDGGFFSVFNRFVSYLAWTLSENPDSIVLPDWRIDAMQKHWNVDRFTSFCYGAKSDGNIWLKLFEPLPYKDFPDASYETDDALYGGAALKDDFNEKNEPWLTYIHAYKLYKSPGFQRWRHWYHLYCSTYIKPRPHIRDKVEKYYDQNLKGYTVISAHIRHPSHGIEQPGSRMPTVELFCEKIHSLMAEKSLTARNTRLFLATDQDTVVDHITREFGGMVVFSPESSRTTQANDKYFNSLSIEEKMREGFQIQHLTAADPNKWSTKMAEEVIVDTYLLAKGDYFIHVTSNIATAVAFINPRIQMHYCE